MTSLPTPPRRALLVQPDGARRAGLAAALAASGWTVETLEEPYAATAHFVASPSDLVVFSLRRFRRQDASFLAALRARRPDVRILALVPARRRAAAAEALAAGADAQLPEPCFPEEFVATVQALFRHSAPIQTAPDDGLRLLAGEVAHAINNPLQILALIGEADGLPSARAQDVRAGVERIRQVTRILVAFGNLRPPQPVAHDLGTLLDDALHDEELEALAGDLRGVPTQVYADPEQVRVALRSMAGFLSGTTPDRNARIDPAIESVNGHDPSAVLSLAGPVLDDAARRHALQSVLMVRDETREVFPGLKIAATVAALNGGTLQAQSRDGGIRLALRLPPVN